MAESSIAYQSPTDASARPKQFMVTSDWRLLQTFLLIGPWIAILSVLDWNALGLGGTTFSGHREASVTALFFGFVIAQFVLLGMLLSWLPARLMFRGALLAAIAGLLVAWILLGGVLAGSGTTDSLFVPIATWLALIVAIAAPFELARLFFGARLQFDGLDDLPSKQFRLATLFKLTALVAIVLALMSSSSGEDDLVEQMVLLASCFVVTATLLPFTWLMMSRRFRWIWIVVVPAALGGFVSTILGPMIFYDMTGPHTGLAPLATLVAGVGFAHGVNLTCLTRLGFRLKTESLSKVDQ